jgi:Ca2+-binding RTX toxin-like protein
MALATQGLGLVGTVIRVSGIPVATHLQFINWSNSHEIEIVNDGFPNDFKLRIDQTDSTTFNRPADDYAASGAIDLGGRNAANVWEIAIQATNSIDAAGLTYELLTQNSNSFINSLFLTLGLDINAYLGAAEPENDVLGFVGVGTDIRDKVAFNIAGTAGDDWFFSGAKADTLYGGEGDDIYCSAGGNDIVSLGAGTDYVEAGSGADALYGGDGTDTLSCYGSTAGVTVSLAYSYAAGGDAQGDTFTGFENLIGSSTGSDTLVGDAAANAILGLGGSDTLLGLGGTDALYGGNGLDWLSGGKGSDYFYGGAAEADYFSLYYDDLNNGDIDYLLDFSVAAGDYVFLSASVQSSTYYYDYGGYALAYIFSGTDYYVFAAANTTAADLQSHTYFF